MAIIKVVSILSVWIRVIQIIIYVLLYLSPYCSHLKLTSAFYSDKAD